MSHHANSRSRYLSIFEACDLYRGLDRFGVVFLAIAALGRSRAASVSGLDTIKAIMIALELLNHGQSGVRLKAK